MKTSILIVTLALLLIGGGYVAYTTYNASQGNPADTVGGRYMDIDTYVRTSISQLSPVKEQVGGTFYVTALETHEGKGVVEYEDGHNAYTADFTYHTTTEGQPVVDSFVIRPQQAPLSWDANSISLGGAELLSIDDFPDMIKVSADAEFGSSDTIKGAKLSPNGDWIAVAVGGAAHDFGWVYNVTTKKLTPVIFSYGGGVDVKGWNSNVEAVFTVNTPQPATQDKVINVTALPQYPR